MRVIHAYNQHRGGGGSDNSTRTTIEVQRQCGMEIEVFTRSSEDLPPNLWGRVQAAASAIYAPGSVRDFAALLDSFRPDVLHVHEVFPLVSPWILPLCTQRRIPTVMTCVDYRMTCPIVTHLYRDEICTQCTEGREYWAVLKNCRQSLPESFTVALYNVLVRKLRLFSDHVARFVAPSEFARQWFIQHAQIDAAKITTVPPVVAIPDSPSDPAAGEYVAFAGRFTREKGIEVLLEAEGLGKLPHRYARAENSLINVHLSSHANVLVTHSPEDLSAFFRRARMLVVPSIWYEAFGLTAAEAMAHGVPIVASRIGSLTGLVQDGVDGLLFEPRNPRDLAEKVASLWRDPERCRSLGRAARQKAISNWTARHHFERLKAVYEQVLASR